jgi:2-polyprenyl-3-methyl-5-hydroxy-6-metoxy-1,4-benzoquinol methylase
MKNVLKKLEHWREFKEMFGKWEGHFDLMIARLRFLRPYLTKKTILDVGCGTGFFSSWIAEEFGSTITGVEINNEKLKYGHEHFKNIAIMKMDMRKLAFEEDSFDVVTSFDTIEHIDQESQEIFCNSVKRVLKPGGIFICNTPNKAVYSSGSDQSAFHEHEKEFEAEELKSFLKDKCKFPKVDLYCQHKIKYPEAEKIIKAYAAAFGLSFESCYHLIHMVTDENPEKAYSLMAICRNN